MNDMVRPFNAYLDGMNQITIIIPSSYEHPISNFFKLINNEKEIPLIIESKIDFPSFLKYVCHINENVDLGQMHWVLDANLMRTDLQIGAVTRTPEFDDFFYYEGKLGVDYLPSKTSFYVWAPTATEVKLKLKSSDGVEFQGLNMARDEKGVWSITLDRDLEYFLYTFLVYVNLQWEEAVDPYANATTANGLEGVVINLKKTKQLINNLPQINSSVDSIIYETHLRDFTIHPSSGVKYKGTYLGGAETATKGPHGDSTCLSYVKELGVTHIELLPINDFAGVDELGDNREYNWGYNPVNYNVPDGSYSLEPQNPYKRIQELKCLIDTLHQNELKVILDVVYNHVYIRETSSFEKIVPGYYFRHDEHGMPSNGTGVGNDLASERKMVRKYIIDSVLYWLNEFQVDGFRFDLMGILDIVTMNEVRKVIDQVNDSIVMIGEGWDLNTPLPPDKKATIGNQKKLPRIGQFNDVFRDSIKGSTFNLYDKGYALGNDHYYEKAIEVIAGSIGIRSEQEGLFDEPCQSVNYVESHDNHTMWDKLMVCLQDDKEEILRKYHRLATGIVLLSQGIPFIHSGQEFFRTKNGDGNSYRSSNEINQLDWDRKFQYSHDVEYIKGLISIRKTHRAFRFPTSSLIRGHMKFLPLKRPLIGWMLKDVGGFGPWDQILVFINPTQKNEVVLLPKGTWNVIANDMESGTSPIRKWEEQNISLKAISLCILVQNQ